MKKIVPNMHLSHPSMLFMSTCHKNELSLMSVTTLTISSYQTISKPDKLEVFSNTVFVGKAKFRRLNVD